MVIWRSLRGSRASGHVATAVRSQPVEVLSSPVEKDRGPYSKGKAEEELGEDDASKEAEWDWIVEAGSLGIGKCGNEGAVGGYISGHTLDGFLICDAPRSIKHEELHKQLALREVPSDTGSAPTTMSSRTTLEGGGSGEEERGGQEGGRLPQREEQSLCKLDWSSLSGEETPPTTVCSVAETPPPPSPRTTLSAPKMMACLWQKEVPNEKHLGDGYYCRCNAPSPILMHNEIVSDSYRAMTGPGYLVSAARNITLSDKQQKVIFTSGAYTVCDAMCTVCGVTLGIKYVGAEPANQHKVGKFLLGQDLLVSSKRN